MLSLACTLYTILVVVALSLTVTGGDVGNGADHARRVPAARSHARAGTALTQHSYTESRRSLPHRDRAHHPAP